MDTKQRLCQTQDNWGRVNEPFTNFILDQNNQKLENPSILDHEMRTEPPFTEFDPSAQNPFTLPGSVKAQDWDPRATLNNLSFLEQKIHQLQGLVHLIVGRKGQPDQAEVIAQQQQQLITADLTSIIVQLISTAGTLLPSANTNISAASLYNNGQLGNAVYTNPPEDSKVSNFTNFNHISNSCMVDEMSHVISEEHELKDEEDADDGENLPPGSYEILQLEKEEILAPHTHFCAICGKGFKRDANLRMHMRGHGDEYKTPAALAKPNREPGADPVLTKRYSCPFPGCKRNKFHKKFQPLKTILCVKNHYKRTHCDKSFTCSRCNTKKFSVIADLKTHEKHCGKDKWLCSCGTTFSRKDKLFGHMALFQGHTPAIPLEETKALSRTTASNSNQAATKAGNGIIDYYNFGGGSSDLMAMKGGIVDPGNCFSPFNFDTCNFGGFHEFPRTALAFDDSESSFSLLVSGSCNYSQKNGESTSNNL